MDRIQQWTRDRTTEEQSSQKRTPFRSWFNHRSITLTTLDQSNTINWALQILSDLTSEAVVLDETDVWIWHQTLKQRTAFWVFDKKSVFDSGFWEGDVTSQ